MKTSDFLAEFDEEYFPKNYTPWISFDAHDPPFKLSELRAMAKRGIINLSEATEQYQLTFKATKERFGDE